MATQENGGQTAPTAVKVLAPVPRITSTGFDLVTATEEKRGEPGKTETKTNFVLRVTDGDVSYWRREQIRGIHSWLGTLGAGLPETHPINVAAAKLGRQILKHEQISPGKGSGRIISQTVVEV